jgi:subtilase family serine protease
MSDFKRRLMTGALACLLLPTILLTAAGTNRAMADSPSSPDLAIAAIGISPEIPSISDAVTFTVAVQNQGDAGVESSRLTCFIDGEEIAVSDWGQVAPAGRAIRIFIWKAKPGAHIFRAFIDSGNEINESDETNNDRTLAFSVTAPDLVVSAIDWLPADPAAGDKITFTVRITNQGDEKTGNSRLELFIDDATRGRHLIPPLEPGSSVNDTFPWTAAYGRHSIRAAADVLAQADERDETNNTREAVFTTALPDLTITSMTKSPEDILLNTEVTFTVNVKNQGAARSGISRVVFYVDDDELDQAFTGILAPGGTAATTFLWKSDNNLHHFKATVFSDDSVAESTLANNTMETSITKELPDLVISDFSWTPSAPLLGEPVSFLVTVKNQGKGSSNVADIKLDIDNNFYIFNSKIAALSVNETGTAVFSWAPRNYTHTVRVTVNSAAIIKESSEANNTSTKTLTSTKPVPTADLVILSMACSPAAPLPAGDARLAVIVKNQGTGGAGASTAALYLDAAAVNTVYVKALGAGETAALDIPISLAGLAFKNVYKVKVEMDCNFVVFETNELNNSMEISVSPVAPDLVIRSIKWTPEAPAFGEPVTFNVTVANIGDAVSPGASVSYSVDGMPMGRHFIASLEPGAAAARSFTWTSQKQPFVFTAVADEADEIKERNESNNRRSVALPAPDLVIDAVTWSPEPAEFNPSTFNIIVKNRGYGPAPATFLSCRIDGAAPALLETPGIDPGLAVTVKFTNTFAAGEHTVTLYADINDTASESDETNNEKTLKLTARAFIKPAPPATTNPAANTTAAAATAPVKTSSSPTTAANVIAPSQPAPQDVSANISAPPPKWQAFLLNKVLIFGVAAVGIGCIGALLVLRKKAKKK